MIKIVKSLILELTLFIEVTNSPQQFEIEVNQSVAPVSFLSTSMLSEPVIEKHKNLQKTSPRLLEQTWFFPFHTFFTDKLYYS